jgi:hypothetical protein
MSLRQRLHPIWFAGSGSCRAFLVEHLGKNQEVEFGLELSVLCA